MNYVGIDIHKRYSVLAAQDESGHKLKEARIEGGSDRGQSTYLDRVRRFEKMPAWREAFGWNIRELSITSWRGGTGGSAFFVTTLIGDSFARPWVKRASGRDGGCTPGS
jgi:hypothetical protein